MYADASTHDFSAALALILLKMALMNLRTAAPLTLFMAAVFAVNAVPDQACAQAIPLCPEQTSVLSDIYPAKALVVSEGAGSSDSSFNASLVQAILESSDANLEKLFFLSIANPTKKFFAPFCQLQRTTSRAKSGRERLFVWMDLFTNGNKICMSSS